MGWASLAPDMPIVGRDGRRTRVSAQLYGLPLERVHARSATRSPPSLRSEGDAEGAAAVKALRKPSARRLGRQPAGPGRARPGRGAARAPAASCARRTARRLPGSGAEQLRAAAEAERAAVDAADGARAGRARADAVRRARPSRCATRCTRRRRTTRRASWCAGGTLTVELRPVGLGPVPGDGVAARAPARKPDAAAHVRAALKARGERPLQREVDAAAARSRAGRGGLRTRARGRRRGRASGSRRRAGGCARRGRTARRAAQCGHGSSATDASDLAPGRPRLARCGKINGSWLHARYGTARSASGSSTSRSRSTAPRPPSRSASASCTSRTALRSSTGASARKEDKEIPFDEVVRGYETSPGRYVVLTKDEIQAPARERGKTIDLEDFVPADQIDPVFYDTPYWLGPQKDADEAYAVLLAALEKTGLVGIGRFALRTREQLVALYPVDGALRISTMRFHDEVRRAGRPRHAAAVEEGHRPGGQDGRRARLLARDRVRPGRVRGHLPRARARGRRGQGPGQADRRARARRGRRRAPT